MDVHPKMAVFVVTTFLNFEIFVDKEIFVRTIFHCLHESSRNKEEYSKLLDQLYNRFGDIHPVQMTRDGLESSAEWIHGCLARLFVHSRLYQCTRFVSDNRESVCPGGCELSSEQPQKLSRKQAVMAKGRRQRKLKRQSSQL